MNSLSAIDLKLSRFTRDGFLVCEKALDNQRVSDALGGVYQILNGVYDTGVKPPPGVDVNHPRAVNRITQVHCANRAVKRLLGSAQIGQIVAHLTGASWVKLWGSQLYFKPGHQSVAEQIGCHRDSQHLPGIVSGGFFAWLPLTEMKQESGTLTYLAGSHQEIESIKFPGAQDPDIQGQLDRLSLRCGRQAYPQRHLYLSPGDFSIHHQDLVHASFCNKLSTPRVAIGISLVTNKTRFGTAAKENGILELVNNPQSTWCYPLSSHLLSESQSSDKSN